MVIIQFDAAGGGGIKFIEDILGVNWLAKFDKQGLYDKSNWQHWQLGLVVVADNVGSMVKFELHSQIPVVVQTDE